MRNSAHSLEMADGLLSTAGFPRCCPLPWDEQAAEGSAHRASGMLCSQPRNCCASPEQVIWRWTFAEFSWPERERGRRSGALVEGPGACRIAHNNSLERTQPQRGFMYDVAVLRRSARAR